MIDAFQQAGVENRCDIYTADECVCIICTNATLSVNTFPGGGGGTLCVNVHEIQVQIL